MTDPHPSALDQILETARTNLQARHAETLERAGRVRAALDAYVNALGAEIAAEFATKNGLPAPPSGQSPIGAALGLRAAVEALPELRSRASAPVAIAPPPPSSPAASSTQAYVAPVEPAPPPPPKRTIVTTTSGSNAARRLEEHDVAHEKPRSSDLDPLTVALIRDMQSLDLARMPQHQFRIWAEELAARARALQDKGADPDSVPGRVIRKLTAIAYEKGIGDIFGLNRKHTANWDDVAERARVRREQALANANAAAEKAAQKKDAPAVEAKPKPIPPPGERMPAVRRAEEAPPASAKVESAKVESAKAEPEPDSNRLQIALLRTASKRTPVVFVGGVVKQEKIALILQKYGIDIEWVDTSRHGTQAIAGVEKRIRERRLAAVVVLQGLIGHKHFEPLVAAARQVGTPFAYADKAGLGSVSRAFTEIEKQLGDAAQERNAV